MTAAITVLFLLFCGSGLWAQPEDMAKSGDTYTATKTTGQKTLDDIIAADSKKGQKINHVWTRPKSETCTTVTYDGPEINLQPGETIYAMVPEKLQGRPLTMATLTHRQDPNLPSNKGFELGKHTTPPGRTSFQVFTPSADGKSDHWRFYGNPSGGTKGSKFAEPRSFSQPEIETLYGWYKSGHGHADTDQSDSFLVKPKAIRLLGVGENPVLVRGISLTVAAATPKEYISHIFSSGTDFGEPVTEKGQKFGGGQAHGGKFPGALVISPFGDADSTQKLPDNWELKGNNLIIPLPAGKKISEVEVAAGDTRPDGKPNGDGGIGTSGWARINLYLKKADGYQQSMAKNLNVAPQGVSLGSPADCDYVTQAGDAVVVEVVKDKAYIMGVRVGVR